MELPSTMFPIIITFFLFLTMALRIGRRSKSHGLKSNLPPGPWKLPITGNMHQLFGKVPHRALRDLARKYGPLMYLRFGEIPVIVVSSPDIAKEVMRTHDAIFASRPPALSVKIMTYGGLDILAAPQGIYWRQLRKLCSSGLLSAARVQSFRSIRQTEAMNLVHWIKSQSGFPINLSKKIASLTFGMTSRAAFGLKSKDHEKFVSIAYKHAKLASGFSLADLFPSKKLLGAITGLRATMEGLHQEVDKILEGIIEEHKKIKETTRVGNDREVQGDMLDILLKEQEEYDNREVPLTRANIKAVMFDIYIAGSEASATTVEWAMSEMMKNPQVMERVQVEVRKVCAEIGSIDEEIIPKLPYLKSVVKETLRLHPPAPLLIPRECEEKCEINGYEIPYKATVMVNAWAMGRDPKYWTDAEKFHPERFLDGYTDFSGEHFEYIPFGAGRRMCPGMLFGLASVEFQLAMLLYHFDWKLPKGMNPEDLDMTESFSVVVGRNKELVLVPTTYDHPS